MERNPGVLGDGKFWLRVSPRAARGGPDPGHTASAPPLRRAMPPMMPRLTPASPTFNTEHTNAVEVQAPRVGGDRGRRRDRRNARPCMGRPSRLLLQILRLAVLR